MMMGKEGANAGNGGGNRAAAAAAAADRLLVGRIAENIHDWPRAPDDGPLAVSSTIMAATSSPNTVLVPVFYRVKPAGKEKRG